MDNALISIIVPIYKVEKYLDKCVESILSQTYKNIELILVDDGSPDNCPQMCDAWANKDNRIKVIHKVNGGLSDARNAGIDAALGDYIMFVDSDDCIRNDMVEKLYSRIILDESELAICNIKIVDEKGNDLSYLNTIDVKNTAVNEEGFWRELYGINYTFCVVAWNKLYSKKLFNNVRYEVGKLHEDEFIIHKIISNCKKISFVEDKLYFYLQRENSIMSNTYSIKRLDCVEAIIERSIYFFNKGWQSLAEFAFTKSIGFIMKGYRELDMKDSAVKSRITEVHKQYKKAYLTIAGSKNSSLKFRLNGLTFYIGPKFYDITHKMKK